jgi:hypothetical protein
VFLIRSPTGIRQPVTEGGLDAIFICTAQTGAEPFRGAGVRDVPGSGGHPRLRSDPTDPGLRRPCPIWWGYGSGVGADEMAYPPGVAVGWVEVLSSVFEPAELGSEALELADATV